MFNRYSKRREKAWLKSVNQCRMRHGFEAAWNKIKAERPDLIDRRGLKTRYICYAGINPEFRIIKHRTW